MSNVALIKRLEAVPTTEWKSALTSARRDARVGIRHAVVRSGDDFRIHVAAIDSRVGCHVHFVGDEDYLVVAGNGVMHWGGVDPITHIVTPQPPVALQRGESFVVNEGYAHQLVADEGGVS